MSLPSFAGDALQDLANITAINALNNRKKSAHQIIVVQSESRPSVSDAAALAAALDKYMKAYKELAVYTKDLEAYADALEAENARLKAR